MHGLKDMSTFDAGDVKNDNTRNHIQIDTEFSQPSMINYDASLSSLKELPNIKTKQQQSYSDASSS